MLLNQLTLMEKETFISLVMKAAEANGVVVAEEYNMFEAYCKEMGIAFFDAKNIKTMDSIIDIYKQSDEKNKKIVLFETIGLMYADKVYDEKEQNFILDFAKKIGLTDEDVKICTKLIIKYLDVLKEIMENVSK